MSCFLAHRASVLIPCFKFELAVLAFVSLLGHTSTGIAQEPAKGSEEQGNCMVVELFVSNDDHFKRAIPQNLLLSFDV